MIDSRPLNMMDGRELRAQLEQLHEASFGWALHCCGRRSGEAEEVLQGAYLKILEGRARYEGRAAFKTWLFAVIRRTACDERRKQWLRLTGMVRIARLQGPTRHAQSAAEVLGQSQAHDALETALSKLSARQRDVLHLVFYQDLTIQQAADVLGISVGSARQHYERGKARIKELLAGLEVRDAR